MHKYTVHRAGAASGNLPTKWVHVGEVSPAPATHVAFHDSAPPRGRVYTYRVAAWNLMGSSEPEVVAGCAYPAWWVTLPNVLSGGMMHVHNPTCGAPAPTITTD